MVNEVEEALSFGKMFCIQVILVNSLFYFSPFLAAFIVEGFKI